MVRMIYQHRARAETRTRGKPNPRRRPRSFREREWHDSQPITADLMLDFAGSITGGFGMTTETMGNFAPRTGGFGPTDARERNFFLALLAGIWIGVVGGFGTDILDHIKTGAPAYLPIVHVHAAVFSAWLLLLSAQIFLIRGGHRALHRRLGMAAAVMVPAMLVLGFAAAWVSHVARYTPEAPHTAFFSIEIGSLLSFGGLAGAGLWLRKSPAGHKRLMLLSTLGLSTAGFARLWDFVFGDLLGEGFWPFFIEFSSAADLLILALGVHDLIRHRRLHPAYLAGVVWILIIQLGGTGLYFSPAWRAFAPHLIGH